MISEASEKRMETITKEQARRFLLRKQGLIGNKRFIGKEGILNYIHQVGCLQYDPIDVCGKNAQLVLQSRVDKFKKQDLEDLLYQERKLVDYYDKVMSIFPIEDWVYFHRIRQRHRLYGRSQVEINEVRSSIHHQIRHTGPICSRDLDHTAKVDWYWSATKLSRAALESMYFDGDLIIHHRKNTMKYYDVSEKYIPKEVLEAEDPFENDLDFIKWRILRRIGSVGFLWNKPSDAFIYIEMNASQRTQAFHELVKEGKLEKFHIEGRTEPFYLLTQDLPLLNASIQLEPIALRMEFLAPLDNMLWDRKLIKFLFGFEYTWEIYVPESKRKYGYYCLPVLWGDRLVARIEVINNKKTKTLVVKGLWVEPTIRVTQKFQNELKKTLKRFMEFNAMETLEFNPEAIHILKEG